MSIEYLTGRTPNPGKIKALIGGKAYFEEFFQQIDALKSGDKLFLLNWNIHPLFNQKSAPDDNSLDGKPSDKYFLTRLQNKVKAGVDVRIQLWINTNLLEPFYPYLADYRINAFMTGLPLPFKEYAIENLTTVYWWRNRKILGAQGNIYEPENVSYTIDQSLKDRIVINTLDSMFGGCHAKFVLFLVRQASGEFIGRGYTGGIDLAPNRYSIPPYRGFHKVLGGDGNIANGVTHNFWHDIMAKVEGVDAVEPLFRFYRNLWNENVQRKNSYNPKIQFGFGIDQDLVQIPCVPDGACEIEELDFDSGNIQEDHLIQSVSTIPDIY